jgi:hypothetical protein
MVMALSGFRRSCATTPMSSSRVRQRLACHVKRVLLFAKRPAEEPGDVPRNRAAGEQQDAQEAVEPRREPRALLSCLAVAFRDGGVLVVDETCDRSVEVTVKRQEIGLVPAHELAPITDSRPDFEDALLGLDEVSAARSA